MTLKRKEEERYGTVVSTCCWQWDAPLSSQTRSQKRSEHQSLSVCIWRKGTVLLHPFLWPWIRSLPQNEGCRPLCRQPPQDWPLPPPRQTRQFHKSRLDDLSERMKPNFPGDPGLTPSDWDDCGSCLDQKRSLWTLESKHLHAQCFNCYHSDWHLGAGLPLITDREGFCNPLTVSLLFEMSYRQSNFNTEVMDIETQGPLCTWLYISWRLACNNLQLLLSHDLERH